MERNRSVKLKARVQQVFYVEYGDWEKFINHHFGVTEYQIAVCEELSNDTTFKFTLTKATSRIDDYDAKRIEAFKQKNGDTTYMTQRLAQDLCMRDILPEGMYIINISW
jgi:hypothetical protein